MVHIPVLGLENAAGWGGEMSLPDFGSLD